MRIPHLLALGVLSLSLAGCGVGQVRGFTFGDAQAWQTVAEFAAVASLLFGVAAIAGLWVAAQDRSLAALIAALACIAAAVYFGSTVANARVQAERYACTGFPPAPPSRPPAERCAAVLEAWRNDWIRENEAQH